VELTVGEATVAGYVIEPQLEKELSPRPYLHPIRTLGGTLVSDAVPDDHRWHLGLALGVQDVNGSNLWGGRTYVRGQGYTWLEDHGRITHEGFDEVAADRLVERLAWRDAAGAELLREQRVITARAVDGGWRLTFGWTLTVVCGPVTLGSPATNGRPDGAGYGGAFFRIAPHDAAPSDAVPSDAVPSDTSGTGGGPRVSAGEQLIGEEQVNGSVEPVVRWHGMSGGAPYTLVFEGLGEGDHWFVRTGIYPGVCAAWAFEQVRVIDESWSGELAVTILDGWH
jgi:hypothetical protein